MDRLTPALRPRPKDPGHIRLGAGAGYAGDRIDPAVELAQFGMLDYLVFELLGERTVAAAQLRRLHDPDTGYDPMLLERIDAVAAHCAANGTTVITNGGAANPLAAARAVAELLAQRGIPLTVAAVTGDDVQAAVAAADPVLWETGRPVSSAGSALISANAYAGSSGIISALARGADIVITGRVADPSLYVAPLCHSFGWAPDDWHRLGGGTLIGHLLECAGQVTGGYFADPVTKPVDGLDRLGFPFADVAADASAVLSKLQGTGGTVTTATCTEQLLYEVNDLRSYLTPDVIADFSRAQFEQLAPDEVRVSGGTGRARPAELKATLGFHGGWEGEGQISYAGPRALDRAQLAAEVVLSRLDRVHGIVPEDVGVEFIGTGAALRRPPSAVPEEVRLRMAAVLPERRAALAVGREVESLYTNGPAGGGGARHSIREVIAVKSASISRDAVSSEVILHRPATGEGTAAPGDCTIDEEA
ncbi:MULTISPECIES: acyclic terpene utilization AtuA family protein [Brevibacterium]|uniref:DUF1446 domain-containing protein n=1 Tax=Brevibacterium salitolerans TaxID=1403566 RepID=A0ABP5IB43_9MICO|nr:acyclic terpene utilization AtuA family protein [Brevibacterium sp.]